MRRISPTDIRICHLCGSDKTYMVKSKYPLWRRYRIIYWLCANCYNKHVRTPKWHGKIMLFKDKLVYLNENPKKGICSNCGKINCKTDMHHDEYDNSDILKHTRELCPSCHAYESWKSGQLKHRRNR